MSRTPGKFQYSMSLKFAPGTLDRLRRSMQARSRVLREDQRVTLVKVSIKVLTALRASAEQSSKKRDVIKNPEREVDKFNHRGHRSKLPKWAILVYRQNADIKAVPVPGARTQADAKMYPAANIKYQGLAKSSFTWMMGKLGAAGGAKIAEKFDTTEVTKHTGFEGLTMFLSVKMVNKIHYIQKAFKEGGKQAVSSALDRAREMLMSDTRRALKKMAS